MRATAAIRRFGVLALAWAGLAAPAWSQGTWTATSATGAPSARVYHSAVWSGKEMIVWGGYDPTGIWNMDTGGRYNPLTDTWTTTTTTGAPTGRAWHTAVWAESQMIVWGGYDQTTATTFNTGARYDPTLDSWTSLPLAGAPSARYAHTAVWTEREMIVWGPSTNTGGRYDPVSDLWTSTDVSSAPPGLSGHVAAWTGREMIVWGNNTDTFSTGGRYDPRTNSWTPINPAGAPTPRQQFTAVWTGREFIVWGGYDGTWLFDDGVRYDPVSDTWAWMAAVGAPFGRRLHTAVWTGKEMVVCGGLPNIASEGGGRYDPRTNIWAGSALGGGGNNRSAVWTGREMIVWGGNTPSLPSNWGACYRPPAWPDDGWFPTSPAGAPSARSDHSGVWTGREVIVWGGTDGTYLDSGGRYDPVLDTWTATATSGAPVGRSLQKAVWTGREMVVWGGTNGAYLDTGGRYDPLVDSWQPTATAGAPSGRTDHTAVCTGREMVVWGGTNGGYLDTGGRYDPASDTWTATSMVSAPAARRWHSGVWTGKWMIIWGGGNTGPLSTGGRYDPIADSWSATSTTGVPAARSVHSTVWTGRQMVVWGGATFGAPQNTGGRYDPFADTWSSTSTAGAPAARGRHVGVWTGREMIVWGGNDLGGMLATGGRYDPSSDAWTSTTSTAAPTARNRAVVVWTGRELVVWGGFDTTYTDTGARYGLLANYAPEGIPTWLPGYVVPIFVMQYQSDGVTPVSYAGSIYGLQVVFKAGANDPESNQYQLEVEYQPTGTAFTNVATATSALFSSGSVAELLSPSLTPAQTYHWQYRFVDELGAASGWLSYGGNADPDDTDFFVNRPPDLPPLDVNQTHDGFTPIPLGGVANDASVWFRTIANDPEGDNYTFGIEVKPLGTPFTNTVLTQTPMNPSGTELTLGYGFSNGPYHWQYRLSDSWGAYTAWVPFGGNSEESADFIVGTTNNPPVWPPSQLDQYRLIGFTAIEVGSGTNEGQVRFRAVANDPDGNGWKLEVELQPVGTGFNDTATVTSSLVPNGSIVWVTSPVLADGFYHWQYRLVDSLGAATAWASYGGNPEGNADFVADASPPIAGTVNDGPAADIDVQASTTTISANWSAFSDPESGIIAQFWWIGTTLGGAETLLPTNIGPSATSATTSSLSLTNGMTYYVTVRATNGASLQTPATSDGVLVSVNLTPASPPSALDQYRLDGSTVIAIGGSTPEDQVVFKATATDPDADTWQLAVEIQPVGTAFADAATATSALVASGAEASVASAVLPDGGYHWQYRLVDSLGAGTAWTSFGGNPEASADFSIAANLPPASPPSAVNQYRLDGSTIIAIGNSTPEPQVIFKAATTDPDADTWQLAVEVQPIGTAFADAATATSALVASGAEASATSPVLADGSYHWQYRLVDSLGTATAWTSFGGNPEGDADFTINVTNDPPVSPASALGEFYLDALTAIPLGGTTTEGQVTFKATTTDPQGHSWKLEVEAQPTGTAFTNAATATSALVASGAEASAPSPVLADGGYHWQYRLIDSLGAATAWTSFGGNPEGDADFVADGSAPTAGTVNDGPAADIDLQASTTTIGANWSGFADAESGLGAYAWAIGSTAGVADVQPFTAVALATTAANAALALTDGQTYFVTVRAANTAGAKTEQSLGALPVATATVASSTLTNCLAGTATVTGSTLTDCRIGDGQAVAGTAATGATYGTGFDDTYFGDLWTGTEFVAVANMTLTELRMLLAGSDATSEVRLYNGARDTFLGRGTFIPSALPGWQGAVLDAPVALAAGATYFLAVHHTAHGPFAQASDGNPATAAYASPAADPAAPGDWFPALDGIDLALQVRSGGYAWATSDGVLVDATPPVAGAVNDGLGADIDVQGSTTTIIANWASFTDPESGITGYEWAIGTTPGAADVAPFAALGLVTSAANASLVLADGTLCFVTIRATSGTGATVTATSDGVIVDTAAPSAGTVWDGLGADIDLQTSSSTISANWSGFSDGSGGGIASYEWAIGTSPGAADVQPFTNVGAATFAVNAALSLATGATYFVAVRAIDALGLVGPLAASDGVMVDATPPVAGAVNDGLGADVDWQASTTTLSANWTAAADPESGIAGYEWAIGTTPGGAQVSPFTPVGLALNAAKTGLSLVAGAWYCITVRATNAGGLMTTVSSDGVWIDATAPLGGTVRDGSGVDIDIQTSTNAISANWSGFADPESGIAGYEWAIGTAPGAADVQPFAPVGLATSGTNGTLALIDGQSYYVVVRATNNGGTTTTAASDGVTIQAPPPAGGPTAPVLLSPADGTTFTDSQPQLHWTPSGGSLPIDYYVAEMDTEPAFANPVWWTATTSATTVATPILANLTTYWWRARAVDTAGASSAWSASWKLAVSAPPTSDPGAPVLISPADGAAQKGPALPLVWAPSQDVNAVPASTYEVEVLTSNGTLAWSAQQAVTAVMSAPLADGAYRWHVRASDAWGNTSVWSESWMITLDSSLPADLAAPAAPALLSPPDASVWTVRRLDFEWSAVSDPAGVFYTFELSRNGTTLHAADVSGTRLTYGLPDNGAYRWRVRATDGAGNAGPWSALWGVTLDPSQDMVAPGTPVLIAPTGGVVITESNATLRWEGTGDLRDIGYFEIQVDDDSAFSAPLVHQFFPSEEATLPLADGSYWWRARAFDWNDNASPWSDVAAFSVDAVPDSGGGGATTPAPGAGGPARSDGSSAKRKAKCSLWPLAAGGGASPAALALALLLLACAKGVRQSSGRGAASSR